MNRLLPLFILLVSSGLLYAQPTSTTDSVKSEHAFYISFRPQTLVHGIALGAEYQLSKKFAFETEFVSHLWLLPRDFRAVALYPSAKWYFTGQVGHGFYAKMKVGVGSFFSAFSEDAEKRFFATPAIGIGARFQLRKGWGLGFETSLSNYYTFGDKRRIVRQNRNSQQAQSDYLRLLLLSPASVVDVYFVVTRKLW